MIARDGGKYLEVGGKERRLEKIIGGRKEEREFGESNRSLEKVTVGGRK